MERPLTGHIRPDKRPLTMTEYLDVGGYKGFEKALAISPAEVQEMVKDADLKGRGGAGFPTGFKWSCVPPDSPRPRYVIANADEMEPGTFKDRLLLESSPHQLLEGMMIAGYAIGACTGFVFLRGEYVVAARHLQRAIEEARQEGLLGTHIEGSDFCFDIHVHCSAGRYICGEETALINALEGKRANPRAKPPFPQVSGLFGQPTVVNNTETLCNVPHILKNGPQWFKALGLTEDAGTKIYGASGHVNNPGLWELPMGTPVREILETHAGGMKPGYHLKGFLPGGASTDFLVEEHLDLAMDYATIAKAGSRLGTGSLIILDDQHCPVAMTLNLIHFFAQESCGWCTPCRDGLPWAEQLLQRIEDGQGSLEDLDQLAWLCQMTAPGNTFCALAPGAAEPLQSALQYFRQDFEDHISQQCCPWGDHS